MPVVGFGTLIPSPAATREAVRLAIAAGFRHFDCAERYLNEQVVGDALQEAFLSGTVSREEVFVTTKLWNTNHRPERVEPALDASCRRLQVDYVDCYLIHTPFAFQPGEDHDPRDEHGNVIYDDQVSLIDTWRALESLVDGGKCRAIGLSDVTLPKLKLIVETARIKPAVVQIESHPYLPEWELLEFCKQEGIVLLAFAPLGHAMEPNVLEDPVIQAIATRLNRTPAQVSLAWAAQRGTAFLTTSVTPHRIEENAKISLLPDDAIREISERIETVIRFNSVVDTGVPGFIPRVKPAQS
ncbi:aldo/keto reductase [Rhizobium ruizarguesonis]|uniref:aldo/keto reductase n=1 Tax=Rhizobium ruizarguesonis TaxID=2081791 RepID=UPI0010309895|nr:aldo/keto reductase [Rhizobium ruizarguesonis]TAW01653.1 aldo/keto reductase [Rhizobium ruizarguesonis]TAW19116.1 aldo/keto reductase [Rhizobium ruizarguesonis]TAZ54808.1 aldo/keto reductase [Rhizobium ruizarguesonis]TBD02708.1 aldo/keto reductase [Rhizobium ruizarguesonis]TBD18854.1 aldo/keto reductase [Rhizobium ruizarguesonis]